MTIPETEHSNSTAYNNWPNDAGFESRYEQNQPIELAVTGSIPPHAAGVLYRTGPGGYKVANDKGETFKMSHWFDGFTKIHRFQIIPHANGHETKVIYNSRNTVDQQIRNIEKTGSLEHISFGQKRDPCESFFKKVMSTFSPFPGEDDGKSARNVGVTLSINLPGFTEPIDRESSNRHASGIKSLIAKTDQNILKHIDPETLEPIGMASQTSLHPDLKGQMSAAHAKSDPLTGDVFNFNLEFSRNTTYRIFCTSATTGKTTILAAIQGKPAYLHSLFLTEDHVILCIWNSHFSKAGFSILMNRNILDSISDFDPTQPATWYVIDRKNGNGLLATYKTPAFFCFHTVNAWSEPSTTDPSSIDIVCDLSAYTNLDVLKRFYYENLLSTAPGNAAYHGDRGDTTRAEYRRYRLHSVPTKPTSSGSIGHASVEFTAPKIFSPELPTLNPIYVTKPHQYTYGVIDRAKSSFVDGLAKFDASTKTAKYWEQKAQSPGEPIFIPNPQGQQEDDGVLLSVVLDGIKGNSYLLCLDARDMSELGRAEVPGVVGFGFHGTHVARGESKALDF